MSQNEFEAQQSQPAFALHEIETQPGKFQLLVSDYSNLDSDMRVETPPPSYRRHEQPALRLVIPPEHESPPSGSPRSDGSQTSGSWSNLEYIPRSLLDKVIIEPGSPKSTSPTSKRNGKNVFVRVAAKFKKSENGIKLRMKKPSRDICPKVTEIRLDNSSSPSTPSEEMDTSNELPYLGHHSCDSPQVAELEGEGLNVSEARLAARSSAPSAVTRSQSVSSIVPTPRRGLTLVEHRAEPIHAPKVSPVDLATKLRNLAQYPFDRLSDAVSPLSPVSPISNLDQIPSALPKRSNALVERHDAQAPGPAGSPLSRPTTTSSLDSRLSLLPRLIPPRRSLLAHMSESGQASYSITSFRPGNIRSQTDIDSSKELANRELLDTSLPIPVDSEFPGQQGSSMSLQNYTPIAGLTTRRPYQPKTALASFLGYVWDSLLHGVIQSTQYIQEKYGPEPPVPSGHVRVRWRCTCGEHVYDDFIEARLGAATELEAYLNRVPNQWPTSPSSSHPSSAGSQPFSANSNPSPLSSQTSWSSQASTTFSPGSLSKQPTRVASGNPYGFTWRPQIEPLWLFACVNEGKWTTKMTHVDVNPSKIYSDKDFALALSGLYHQVNRKWYKLFKLRGLVSINFVQFELHRNRYADISKSPALPHLGSEYEFQPNELIPPVGSNYLMHLFKHPEDYDDELITYLRSPKRRERLEIGTGWGLQLVEGFLPERLWAAVLLFFFFGSLVFAIVWACKRNDDIQGAFGVASWMVALAGLVVSGAQTWVD